MSSMVQPPPDPAAGACVFAREVRGRRPDLLLRMRRWVPANRPHAASRPVPRQAAHPATEGSDREASLNRTARCVVAGRVRVP